MIRPYVTLSAPNGAWVTSDEMHPLYESLPGYDIRNLLTDPALEPFVNLLAAGTASELRTGYLSAAGDLIKGSRGLLVFNRSQNISPLSVVHMRLAHEGGIPTVVTEGMPRHPRGEGAEGPAAKEAIATLGMLGVQTANGDYSTIRQLIENGEQ